MDEHTTFYLEKGSCIDINQLLVSNSTVKDSNLLESAIAAPQQSAYYEGADIMMQAALLIERLVLNHPFTDGNKRTALIAGSTFLLVNGLRIVYMDSDEDLAYAKEIERLVVSRGRERFYQWLAAHSMENQKVEQEERVVLMKQSIELSMKQFAQELVYLKDR
ncbi:MAG TPA: type II toxin-antitoxin system death-on-curing family toxin [Dictyobacter sp.]|nr:type II toxin-antitoxin system death-on-curing family toxin [Dictyobacter sp.]